MAVVSGSIDNFRVLSDGRIMVGGWAFFDKANKKPCSTIQYSDQTVDVHRSNRPDISDTDNFGFHFHLNDEYQLLELVLNKSFLTASYESESKALGVWAKLKERIYEHLINSFVDKTGEEFQSKLLVKMIHSVRGSKPNIESNGQEYSNFDLEVGAVTFDSNVIVGRDSQLFLFEGSNKLHLQYCKDESPKLVSNWLNLIESRGRYLAAENIGFLQLIVPEKQSILHDKYPMDVTTPTANLRVLEEELKEKVFYSSVYDLFSNLYKHSGHNPYQKADTHLSLVGVSNLAQLVLTHFGLNYQIDLGEVEFKRRSGDLGNKLVIGKAFCEELHLSDCDKMFNGSDSLELVEKFDPTNGHSGALRKWTNESAPIDKSIVIMGNSVSERGTSQFGLSWWLSRVFKRTTFCWSSAMLTNIIEDEKPDYVICQTVERFLPTVPKS
jgi:hypothetical protein